MPTMHFDRGRSHVLVRVASQPYQERLVRHETVCAQKEAPAEARAVPKKLFAVDHTPGIRSLRTYLSVSLANQAVYTHTMSLSEIVQSIDAEIERLSKARALLTGHTAPLKRAGAPARKRGTMSAEGRARIAAAQKVRWAKVKRA
jgi:hypothetical protein